METVFLILAIPFWAEDHRSSSWWEMASVQPMWYNAIARLYIDRLNEHDAEGVEELLASPCHLEQTDVGVVHDGYRGLFSQKEKLHYHATHFAVPKVEPKVFSKSGARRLAPNRLQTSSLQTEHSITVDYEREWMEHGHAMRHAAQDSLSFDGHGLITRVAYTRKPVAHTRRASCHTTAGPSPLLQVQGQSSLPTKQYVFEQSRLPPVLQG